MKYHRLPVRLGPVKIVSVIISPLPSVIDVLGGSGGASSVPAPTSSPSQSRDSSGGDGSAFENGSRHRRGIQRAGLETWEMTYSDSGQPYYTEYVV